MFKIEMTYPDQKAEQKVLREHHANAGKSNPTAMDVKAVVSPADIVESRQLIRATHVRDEVINYVSELLKGTRNDDGLSVGASPRAGLMLLMGAKSLARFADRDFVIPDDVQQAFLPTMRHRVVLAPSTELEGTTADEVLAALMESVEVPR